VKNNHTSTQLIDKISFWEKLPRASAIKTGENFSGSLRYLMQSLPLANRGAAI
jgi:hypothetical protein